MLRAEGHVLAVANNGTVTRFDLSPLLTMETTASRERKPIFSSIEGRRGHLMVTRFDRFDEPGGPQFDDMQVSIVLY